jgi:integrase
MNDLTISGESDVVLHSYFQNLAEGLRKAQTLFERIHSFEDIEMYLLRGAGLASETYRVYLWAVKQFYDFTDGLNPLQVLPAHIEAFYDYLLARQTKIETANHIIRGLKHFFKTVASRVPGFSSPFDVMEPALLKKLNRRPKGNRTKDALTVAEVKSLLAWLAEDKSTIGLSNYAIVFMLITSGLRNSEILQLRWKDLKFIDGVWTAQFIGKGNRDAEQELYAPAVEVCQTYFKTQFHRDPKPNDFLIMDYRIKNPHKFTRTGLLKRVQRIGQAAQKEGIIKRPVHFTVHLCRRSYATFLYKSGMQIKAIQAKTRHENIDVLMNHYIDDREAASPYFAKILN